MLPRAADQAPSCHCVAFAPRFSPLPAYATRFFLAAQYFLILSARASCWAFVRLGRARLALGCGAGAIRAASGFVGGLPRRFGMPPP